MHVEIENDSKTITHARGGLKIISFRLMFFISYLNT